MYWTTVCLQNQFYNNFMAQIASTYDSMAWIVATVWKLDWINQLITCCSTDQLIPNKLSTEQWHVDIKRRKNQIIFGNNKMFSLVHAQSYN